MRTPIKSFPWGCGGPTCNHGQLRQGLPGTRPSPQKPLTRHPALVPHQVFQVLFTGAEWAEALLDDLVEGPHVVHGLLQLSQLSLVLLQLQKSKHSPLSVGGTLASVGLTGMGEPPLFP